LAFHQGVRNRRHAKRAWSGRRWGCEKTRA
jgi:hypothetical protein